MEKYVDAIKLADTMRKMADSCQLSTTYDTGHYFGIIESAALVESTPAADVAPVRHGTWVDNIISVPGVEEWGDIEREIFAPDYKDGYKCSLCGEQTDRRWFRFCPRCGARMDAECGG